MTIITLNTSHGDGRFDVYAAGPPGRAKAGIIVIQEVFGVNAGIRRKCDQLAQAGYLAMAPDLFWRIAPGIDLDPDVPEQLEQGIGLAGRFDQEAGVEDLETTIREVRSRVSAGRVGAVGYCMGGRMAYKVAARTDIDASVGYYGVGLEGLLGEKHGIARPLMLHIAGRDHFVGPDAQARIHEGLDDHPRVTIHDYPDVDHGFATEIGARRDGQAAELADRRTLAFFAEHLA